MLSFYRQHLRAHLLSEQLPPTVDQEILTSKIICIKNFVLLKFTWFHSICEIFITVDNCNMEERLESSLRFVYYQASGDPRIAGCSCWSDIYLRECGLTCGSLFTDHHHVILFFTCYIFTVGFDREIILTAKFSQSFTVTMPGLISSPYSGDPSEVFWACARSSNILTYM